MRGLSAKGWLLALAAMSLLGAAAARAEALNSGAWRVVKQEKAPEYSSNLCIWEGWTGAERKGGKSIIRWADPLPDKDGGKPVKFILMFGDADESGAWYKNESKVRDWFDCQGQGQWEWYVETAADVCELVDLNADEHYRLWIAVEYASGKRLPFDGKDFIAVSEYNDETKKTLSPSAVKLTEGYKWDDKNSSFAGNKTDANGKVDANGFNVVTKAKAAPYGGKTWAVKDWGSARKPSGKAVIRWVTALEDKVGGKPVKFLLFFGGEKAKCGVDNASTQAWYECRGEGQWDWFLEVGADVRQIFDPNEGKYRVWMAVEYESGLRRLFYGDTWPVVENYTDKTKLDDNCVKIPEGYKFAGSAAVDPKTEPKTEPKVDDGEKINIKDKMPLYSKEGRSWTMKTVTKMTGMDDQVSYMKYEITRVTDTECIYNLVMMDKDKKETMTMKDQKISFLVPKPKDSDPKPPEVKTSDETVDVPAGKIDCVKSESEAYGMKTTSWISKKMSGLLVKSASKSDTMESTTELIEFKD